MTRLQEYPWPGNVRELQNVIEQAVTSSTEAKLRLPDDLRLADSKRDGDP
jgi:DNA-binding NtrC family response regulator